MFLESVTAVIPIAARTGYFDAVAGSSSKIVPNCKVSVGGTRLEGGKEACLAKVEIDLDVDLFGQCTLDFNDSTMKLMAADEFKAGAAVKVEIGYGAALKTLFEGEVVALEPQFRRDLPIHLRVLCQETLHRLALAAMTRSFHDVDDGEVLKKVAQAHGLSSEGPSGTKGHLLQQNTSDAVLLRRLAQMSGHHLRLEGKKLIIADPPDGEELAIGPADGLRKLKVKIKAGTQVGEVAVHGYDPKTKKEFVGKAKGEGVAGEGSKKFGHQATLAFAGHEHPPADLASAEKMAKGRMRKLAEGHVTVQVEMIGNAELLPGTKVKLDKFGPKVDGSYRVEQVRHDFARSGFSSWFRATLTAKKKPPAASAKAEPTPDTTWLELKLVDAQGQAVPGQRYKVVTASGEQFEGTLDGRGQARLTGIPHGSNKVSFPDYAPEWRRA